VTNPVTFLIRAPPSHGRGLPENPILRLTALKETDAVGKRSSRFTRDDILPKILRAMKENGSPPPEFEFDEDHSYFLVRLPVHPEAGQITEDITGVLGLESRPESRPESDVALRILAILQESPKSRSEIARSLGHKSISGAVNKTIAALLKDGLIAYTLPDKPQSRLQKYRLTQGKKST
jgi:ATP-dependent DNA helicase RecG